MKKIFSKKATLQFLFIFSFSFPFLLLNCSDIPKKMDKVTIYQSSVLLGDPHIVNDSANRLSLIFSVYEALVSQDEKGNYLPALAESWIVGEDNRTWTFSLRRNVTFHNGDILNAGDVLSTLKRVLDPALGGSFGTQGVYISYLGDADISILDDFKVRIVTREPMADLLDLLSAMPISPKSALNKLPDEHVGSGPYRISKETATKTILTAYKKYWGKVPAYNEIHWIAERDETKRVTALLKGQADIIPGINLEGRDRIKKDSRAILHEIEKSLCIIFMCNAQKGPCKDRRVRQALNYAVDVEAIIAEIKKGAAKPLNGYLTPLHFGYNRETPAYPYDPKKARSLLAKAGHKEGLKLVFDIPATMPDEAPQLAKMMVNYFNQVGITVEIVVHEDRAAYADMVRAKKINDACCFDSSPRSTYRVLREKLQSTLRGPWWQGYENKKVNALINKAEATIDKIARQKIYQQIFTIVRNDAPWIFLYNPIGYHGVSSRLKGWKPRRDGLLIFK